MIGYGVPRTLWDVLTTAWYHLSGQAATDLRRARHERQLLELRIRADMAELALANLIARRKKN